MIVVSIAIFTVSTTTSCEVLRSLILLDRMFLSMEWYVGQEVSRREIAIVYSLSQIVPIVPIALVKRAGARGEEGIIFHLSDTNPDQPLIASQLNPGSRYCWLSTVPPSSWDRVGFPHKHILLCNKLTPHSIIWIFCGPLSSTKTSVYRWPDCIGGFDGSLRHCSIFTCAHRRERTTGILRCRGVGCRPRYYR